MLLLTSDRGTAMHQERNDIFFASFHTTLPMLDPVFPIITAPLQIDVMASVLFSRLKRRQGVDHSRSAGYLVNSSKQAL